MRNERVKTNPPYKDRLFRVMGNHWQKVMDVCITEYNEKTFVDGIREEGREEERIKAIRNMIELGLTKEQILMKYSEKEYEKAEHEMLANV